MKDDPVDIPLYTPIDLYGENGIADSGITTKIDGWELHTFFNLKNKCFTTFLPRNNVYQSCLPDYQCNFDEFLELHLAHSIQFLRDKIIPNA